MLAGDMPGDDLSTAQLLSLTHGTTTEVQETIGDGAYGDDDVDLFRVELFTDDTFSIDVDAQVLDGGGMLSGLNSWLRFFDSQGAQLAWNDDEVNGSTTDSALTYQITADGTYYVGVSAADNDSYDPTIAGSGWMGMSNGDYILQLLATTPTSNQAPSAVADQYDAPHSSTLTVAAPGVLSNDSDPEQDPITASLVTSPVNGSVTLRSDGSFDYVPNSGFLGTDSFTYVASDGQLNSQETTVSIEVVNQSPAVRSPVPYRQVPVNSADLVIDLSGTFHDADTSDSITLALQGNTNPQLISTSLLATTLTLTIAPGKTGEAMLTVRGSDPHGDYADEVFFVEVVPESELVNDPIQVTASHDISSDTDGVTTLREAIALADAQPGPDTVQFALSSSDRTVFLKQASSLSVSSNLTIEGPTSGEPLVITIDPVDSPAIRFFSVAAGADVTLSELTLKGGAPSSGNGGAVLNDGQLLLRQSMVLDSQSPLGSGGGLYNTATGTLTLEESTVANNSAGIDGGGLTNEAGGTVTLISSTISGNTASASGGGLYNAGTLQASYSTIAYNAAVQSGSGIESSGTSSVNHVLVAGNTTVPDVGGAFTSLGHNLVGDVGQSTGFDSSGANGDKVGGVSGAAALDPVLGPLQDNGAKTWTHQLLPGSPAIDAGENTGSPVSDQRGAPRILDGLDPDAPLDEVATIDIGAYEFGTFIVNATKDLVDTTPSGDGRVDVDTSQSGDQISLRAAVQELNALAGWNNSAGTVGGAMEGVILLDVDVNTLHLTRAGSGEDAAAIGDLDVYGNLLLRGKRTADGVYMSKLDGGWTPWVEPYYPQEDRIFHALPGSTLRLESVYVTGGYTVVDGDTDEGNGGLLFNDEAFVEVVDSYFGESPSPPHAEFFSSPGANQAFRGGAIYSRGGQLSIVDSILEGNEANVGAALYVESGSVSIGSSELNGNTAYDLYLSQGGGLFVQTGDVTIDASLVIHNVAMGQSEGAGLHNQGGSLVVTGESSIVENYAYETIDGAGIFNGGDLSIEEGVRLERNASDTIEGPAATPPGADFRGAALFNTGSARIVNASIDHNGWSSDTATMEGGGIYNDGGILLVEGGSISGNLTKDPGGAIYNNNGDVTLRDVELIGNSSYLDGHAIFNTDLDANLTILDSTIRDHGGQLNGTVSNQYGTVVVRGSTFVDNSTSMEGIAADTPGFAGGAVHHRGENLLLTSTQPLRTTLAAAVNAEQEVLFVNGVDLLLELPLPIDVLIDEERMSIVEIDAFREALIVERGVDGTIPSTHSVSAEIYAADYITVSNRNFLDRYSLPLDIVIGNEVLTVIGTYADSELLRVDRGRYGTQFAQHKAGQNIWGLGGSLTIKSSTFSGNEVGESANIDFDSYPGSAVFSYLQPYVRPTVVENSTFVRNFSTGSSAISALRAPDSLDGLSTDPAWSNTGLLPAVIEQPALLIQNSVIAGGVDPNDPSQSEVMGYPIVSGGNNFIGIDEVNEIRLAETTGIDSSQTTLLAASGTILPAVPFKVFVSHIDRHKKVVQEGMIVTNVIDDGDLMTLTVQRGADGTAAVWHPSDTLMTISQTGFWHPGDTVGNSSLRGVLRKIALDEPTGIDSTQTTVTLVSTTDLPTGNFTAMLVHETIDAIVSESVLVTGLDGKTVTIRRGADGTTAVTHPSDAVLAFGEQVDMAADPRLGPLTDNGGSTLTHSPLPDSPLLDAGSGERLVDSATVSSGGLAATYHLETRALMAVPATGFTVSLASFAFADETVISVDDTSALPAVPFLLEIDDELLTVSAVDAVASTLTVARGQLDTSPDDHQAGTVALFGTSIGADPATNLLHLAETTGLPSAPFVIRAGGELMRVTSVDAQYHNITVERAVLGTTIQSHEAGVFTEHGTLLEVSGASGLPPVPFLARLGTESVWVDKVVAEQNYVVLQRGLFRSSPQEHLTGTTLLFNESRYAHEFNGRFAQLLSTIDAQQTQLELGSTPGLPTETPFEIRIGDEILQVTALLSASENTATWEVQRGVRSSTPAAHIAGSQLSVLIDQRGAQQFNDSDGDEQQKVDIGAVDATIYVVTTTSDLDELAPGDGRVETSVSGEISLRAAVAEANASPGAAVIVLPEGVYSLGSELQITDMTRIVGVGAATTTVQGIQNRVFSVTPAGDLHLVKLTVSGGNSVSQGGGIFVDQGKLTLDATAVSNNSATDGAGIFNSGGQLTLSASSLTGNTASNNGGAVTNEGGNATIRNTTVSGNSATNRGGGIWNQIGGHVASWNSTIANNSAAIGGGVDSDDHFEIANTIVASNSASVSHTDVKGGFESLGHNLIGSLDPGAATLVDHVTATENVLLVQDAATVPPTPFPVLIGQQEEMLVTEITGNQWQVQRGHGGSTAIEHPVGAAVRFHGLWRAGDQTGTVGTPIDPQLGPLEIAASETYQHRLLPASPAVDSGDAPNFRGLETSLGLSSRWSSPQHILDPATFRRLYGTQMSIVDWQSLPRSPFDVEVAGSSPLSPETVTVLATSNGFAHVAQTGDAFPSRTTGTVVTVLTDQAGASRQYDADNNGANQMDIGAHELVPELIVQAVNADKTETAASVEGLAFSVERSRILDRPIDVSYSVTHADGTFLDEDDFGGIILPSGTIHFASGETTKSLVINPSQDAQVESDEEFYVVLHDASSGALIREPVAHGAIRNDDSATITITDPVVEEGSPLVFDVTLSHAVQGGFILPWSSSDGSATLQDGDYKGASGFLLFEGKVGEVQSIVIYTQSDQTVELDETVVLNLSALERIAADAAADMTVPLSAIGTIQNDDQTNLVVQGVRQIEGDAGSKLFEAIVKLSHPVDAPFAVDMVSADITATAGFDYTAFSKTLNFTGTAGESQPVTFSVTGDTGSESDETLALNLSNLQSGGRESSFQLTSSQATILNDDGPRLVVLDAELVEGDSGAALLQFDVILLQPTGGAVTVDIATQDGTATSPADFTSTATTLSFVGNDDEVQTFSVPVQGDGFVELDESFTVALTNLQAGGNEAAYSLVGGDGTIRNNDDAALLLNYTGRDATGFHFDVSLSGEIDYPFTVDAATFDVTAVAGQDYQATSAQLSFTGANGETASMTVPRLSRANPDGIFAVEISSPETAGLSVVADGPLSRRIGESGPDGIDDSCVSGEFLDDWITYSHHHEWIRVDIIERSIPSDVTIYTVDVSDFPDSQLVRDKDGNLWIFRDLGTGGEVTGDPSVSGGSGFTKDHVCPPDDDVPPPPAPSESPATIHADWAVPHTGSLTFNPFPTFNYRLAEDVGVTIGSGTGFARIGDTVSLQFGTITVNADMTLTYDPYDDLASRTGSSGLQPELDANGNVFRFTGIESFEAHVVDNNVIQPLVLTAEGEASASLPLAYASIPVELAVSNHLPTLRGDRMHASGPTTAAPSLDSPVFADFETSYRIDLRDLFGDLDGEDDLGKLRVVDVTYAERRLDENNIITPDINEDPDGDSQEFRVAIGATQKLVNGFYVDDQERDLIVRRVGEHQLEVHNTVSATDVGGNWNDNYPSQLSLFVHVTDGTPDKTKPITDGSGNVTGYESYTWDVHVDVRPRNQKAHQFNWRTLTTAPEVDFRPWVAEITPTLPERYPNDTGEDTDLYGDRVDDKDNVNPADWRIVSAQAGVAHNSESVGGVDVDLHSGEFRRYHDLILDGSGGASEMAIPGLVYDSSTVHVDAAAMPVVQAVLKGKALPTGSTITANLTWYNASGPHDTTWTADQAAIDAAQTEFVVAISPSQIDDVTGVYGWELTVNISNGTDTVTLRTAGETPVVAAGDESIFGKGWQLAGVPNLSIGYRDESSNNAAFNSHDDRIVLAFPGEAPKIFNASDLTYNDYSYAGALPSLQPGSTEVSYDGFADPQEFGTLTSRQNPDELVYEDGTGKEYVFGKHVNDNGTPTDTSDDTTSYLIDRIEQPGIDFDTATNTWPAGRRGISFVWDTNWNGLVTDEHPILTSLTATDGTQIDFNDVDGTEGDGYIDSLAVSGVSGLVREVLFTTNAAHELVEIRHKINPGGATAPEDRVRRFSDQITDAAGTVLHDYSGRLATDQWLDGADNLVRHTQFLYENATGSLSEIQFGDGNGANEHTIVYDVIPASTVGWNGANAVLSDLVGQVDITANYERYNEDTKEAESAFGTNIVEQQFTIDGLSLRREEFFHPATLPIVSDRISISTERWGYDHVGSVKRYTDPFGRQTYYWYDYEEPLDRTEDDPNDGNADTEPSYDPNDYRGNVTYVFAHGGFSAFEYETDDETQGALGRLVKLTENANVNASGQSQTGGSVKEIVTEYERNADGRLASQRTIRGDRDTSAPTTPLEVGRQDLVESWTYNGDGYLASYTDARGLVTSYPVYESSRVKKTTATDTFDGQTTETDTVYDAQGFLDTVTVTTGGVALSVTDYDYDAVGQLVQVESRDGLSSILSRTRYTYAPDGILIDVITPDPNDSAKEIHTFSTNDRAGLLLKTTTGTLSPDGTPATYYSLYAGTSISLARTTEYTYYADGSVATIKLPDGTLQTRFFDAASRTTWSKTNGISEGVHDGTRASNNSVKVVRGDFDEFDRQTGSTDLVSKATTQAEYSPPTASLPTTTFKAGPVGSQQTATRKSDSRGRILVDKKGNREDEVKYDELGYAVAAADIVLGELLFRNATHPAGDVVQAKEFRNGTKIFTTNYVYDQSGRLRKTTDPLTDGVDQWTDEIGAAPATVDYTIDAGKVKVTHTSRAGVQTHQWLDALGRVAKETAADGSLTEYVYDLAGNLIETKWLPVLGDDLTTKQTYDSLGRLRLTTYESTALEFTPFFEASDYFDNGTTGADEWNEVHFIPLEIVGGSLDITNPTTYALPEGATNVAHLATRTRFDAEGKPFYVQSPDPSSQANDTPTTILTYEYVPDLDAASVTTRLSVSGNVTNSQGGFDATYVYQRVHREISNSLGQTVMTLTRMANFNDSDAVSATTSLDEFADPGFVITGRADYYLSDGQLKTQTDAVGNATHFTYDHRGNKEKITDALGNETHFTFDSAGVLRDETDPRGNRSRYHYDALNRVTLIRDALGNDTQYAYQSGGQHVETTNAGGFVTTTATDPALRTKVITRPEGIVLTSDFDSAGNVIKETDALGHGPAYQYDAVNRRTQRTPAPGETHSYTYDVRGNQETLTDSKGNVTTWKYDTLGRIDRETNQLADFRQFQYDVSGNLIEYTDRNGRVTEYVVDGADRRTAEKWLDAGGAVQRTISTDYDDIGRIESISDPAATIGYTNFHGAGPAKTITNNIASLASTVTLTQGFDPAGNRSSLSVKLGATDVVTNGYAYDALNRLDDITHSGASVESKFIDYVYDAVGRLTNVDRYLGASTADPVVARAVYTHDDASRLTDLTYNDPAGAALAGYDWTYDTASRVTQFVSPDGTASYGYDDTDQLLSETYVGTSIPSDKTYTYDENGNRNSAGYVTGPNNQTTSDGTYSYEYDAEGNRTRRTHISSGAVTEYAWDHRNRLVKLTELDSIGGTVLKTVEYTYDPLNRRIAKAVDSDGAGPDAAETTFFIHDGDRSARGGAGDHVVLRLDGSGNVTNTYLHGASVDEVLADENSLGDVLWPLTDNLGSVRDIATYDETSSTTTVANHIVYDAFGNVVSETDAAVDHIFGFTGRERDEESDLQYNRARYYAATLGRFISQDPIAFEAGDANLYRYAGNNAVGTSDPSGLQDRGDLLYRGPDPALLEELQELGLLEYAMVEVRNQGVLDRLYRDRGITQNLHIAASQCLNSHGCVRVPVIENADTAVRAARIGNITRRIGGGVEAAAGGLEMVGAVPVAALPVPGARPAAAAMAAHGADHLQAGVRTAATGQIHRTALAEGTTTVLVLSGMDDYSARRMGDYTSFLSDFAVPVAGASRFAAANRLAVEIPGNLSTAGTQPTKQFALHPGIQRAFQQLRRGAPTGGFGPDDAIRLGQNGQLELHPSLFDFDTPIVGQGGLGVRYHYGPGSAIDGILESGVLRATDVGPPLAGTPKAWVTAITPEQMSGSLGWVHRMRLGFMPSGKIPTPHIRNGMLVLQHENGWIQVLTPVDGLQRAPWWKAPFGGQEFYPGDILVMPNSPTGGL